MIEVSLADESDQQAWESYIERVNPDHHAFSWHWRSIIKAAFGHKPHYFLARDSNKAVCGVLPLFHVRSVLFGSALISLPYLNAGGIIADSDAAFTALLARATELAESLNADYMELRHRAPLSETWPALVGVLQPPLVERSHKVSMILPVQENHEELFASLKPKLRAQIKRPSKSGIHAELSEGSLSAERSLEAFYTVFSEHMRDLGTPVFPKRLFSATKYAFGPACRIITVWHSGQPIAAGITVRHKDRVEIPWASALRRYSREAPNMLLYWQAIKTACIDGATSFDFGRSSHDSGPHRFKQQWGAKSLPLYWYYSVGKGSVPDINPDNPKYAMLVSCWRRLPLVVANTLGPRVTRSLP